MKSKMTITQYDQKWKYIMQTRSSMKSKLIRRGPYLQIRLQKHSVCITWYNNTCTNRKCYELYIVKRVFNVVTSQIQTYTDNLAVWGIQAACHLLWPTQRQAPALCLTAGCSTRRRGRTCLAEELTRPLWLIPTQLYRKNCIQCI